MFLPLLTLDGALFGKSGPQYQQRGRFIRASPRLAKCRTPKPELHVLTGEDSGKRSIRRVLPGVIPRTAIENHRSPGWFLAMEESPLNFLHWQDDGKG